MTLSAASKRFLVSSQRNDSGRILQEITVHIYQAGFRALFN